MKTFSSEVIGLGKPVFELLNHFVHWQLVMRDGPAEILVFGNFPNLL
jgi:hypothetical protein